MRRPAFLIFFLLSVPLLTRAQDKVSTTDKLRTEFIQMPAGQWDAFYNQNKLALPDSVIDGWRSDVIAFYNNQEFDLAHQLIDVCLRITTLSNNTNLNGMCLLVKAEVFYTQGEYRKAVEQALEAGKVLKQAKNNYQLARSLNRLGVSYQALEDEPNSRKAFEQAISIKKQLLKESPDNRTYLESLYGSVEAYGNALYSFSKFDEAITVYQEAIELTHQTKNKSGEGAMNYNLGLVYYQLDKPKESLVGFENSITSYTAAGDSGSVVNSYRQILRRRNFLQVGNDFGTIFRKGFAYGKRMKDKTEVLKMVETCLQPYKGTNQTDSLVYFYNAKLELFHPAYLDSILVTQLKIGKAYEDVKGYNAALLIYQGVYDEYIKKGELDKSADIAETIGSLYQTGLEDFKKADQYFQTSVDLFTKSKNVRRQAGAWWSKAYNQSVSQKDYVGGIDSYQKAAILYTQLKDTTNANTLLCNIGLTYSDMNDSLRSYQAFQQAINLSRKNSDPNMLNYDFDKTMVAYDHFKSSRRKLELLLQRYEHNKLHHTEKVAVASMDVAKQYEERGNRAEADRYYGLGIGYYQKMESPELLADAYWRRAYNQSEFVNEQDKRDYSAGIENYHQAARYYESIHDTTNWKTLLSNIAVLHRLGGDSVRSYQAHEKAIDLTRSNSDPENFIYSVDKAVTSAETFHSFRRQLKYLEDKLEFLRKRKLAKKEHETIREIAKVYENREDLVNAARYYEPLVSYYEQMKDTVWMADSYWNLAYCRSEFESKKEGKQDYSVPLELYTKAMKLYAAQGDTSNWKTLLNNIAIMHRNVGDSTGAYRANEEAIVLTLHNSNPDNLIYSYQKAAETASHFKHYRRRIAYLEKKLAVCRSKKDFAATGEILESLGKIYEDDLKVYPTAAKFYTSSLEDYKKSNKTAELAGAYWNLAYNYSEHLDRRKEAIEFYKKALPLYLQITDTVSASKILANIGGSYRVLSDSVNSYRFHQQSIDLVTRNSDPMNLAYVYSKAAVSYGHFKKYGRQLVILDKELAIYQKLNKSVKESETLKTIAKVYEENLQDYKKADVLYKDLVDRQARTTDLDAQAYSWWNYGYNLGLMQKYEEAISSYEKAYTLFIANKDTSNASVMRSNVGQTQWSLENFDKAIEAHQKAIELATKGKNQEMIYKSWNALADLYKETGNPVKGTEALGNAIGALEILKDSTKLSSAYSKIASSYSKAKEYGKSYEYYEKAVNLNKIRKDTAAWASALYDWGQVLNEKKEYVLAAEKIRATLPLYRRIKSKTDEVYSLVWLGIIEQSSTNDYKKVEGLYNEAVSLAKQTNNEGLMAFCYYQMRYLYRSTGRAALADENAEKSLALYRKLKNWTQVANTLSNIANDAHYVYGDLAKSMKYYDEAQAIADTLSDKSILANIIGGRATVYEDQGDFNKSLETIDKSYDLYKSLNNEWGIAGTYIDRGNVYKILSEYEMAMRYQSKADSMYLKMGTEYARLAPLANLGENYVSQGNFTKGLEYTMKSYEIMKKAGDEDANMCIIKSNIGDIYYQMGDLEQAEKWLKDALANSQKAGAKRIKIDILGELGRLKIDQKKYAEAEVYLTEGVALGKETGVVLGYLNTLVLMGKLRVEQKQFEKAKAPLEETYRMSKNIGKDNTLWESLYLLGLLYKNTGDLQKSKDYLIESEKVIEKIRNKVVGGEEAKKLFSSDKNILRLYDALVEVLLARGETEEALTYLQKNNEENLKAKFKGIDVKFEDEKKQRAVEEERLMKAKLDGIEKQIALEKSQAGEKQNASKLKTLEGVKTIAESEYLKFVNQQINVQPELSKYFNNSVQPTQFRKIKTKIPKDMALVSYLTGENQLYIFAATSDTVVAKIVTVTREQLTKDINGMLNIILHNLGTFSTGDPKNELSERQEIVNEMKQTEAVIKPFEDAYHYLIAPVAKEIAGKSKLGIIPTGSLNYVPFQMLGKTLSSGKFSLLMNQFAIFYANSTDMLFRDEAEIDKKYNILAFGNPDLSLPSTEKEVNDIKTMYPNAAVFLRADATEDKAKYASEQYNVMHFATHGNLDYEDFSKSYITMAGNPAKSEDGRLTLEELWGMEVMNHLNIVVLSACQTAVTKGSNESSAVSPASGFLQNGVKSVVASLWKVDDEATSQLMTGFYRNIKTMTPVDALRSSQRDLSKTPKFSHPYFWAGFILIGDWR